MSSAKTERAEAAKLPGDDIIGMLLQQHARIRDLFAEVDKKKGEQKEAAFEELRAVLAVHETAEEMILRPVSSRTAGRQTADARNQEEQEATKILSALERLDVASAEFDALLAEFEKDVIQHAESEENEEFPAVRDGCDEDQLQAMGRQFRQAEKLAPTHPHPTAAGSPAAQWIAGPFASLVDRVRDTLDAERHTSS